MNKLNEEQHEAEMENAERVFNEYVSKQPVEIQEKYKILNDARLSLEMAGIRFCLIASPESGANGWMTFGKLSYENDWTKATMESGMAGNVISHYCLVAFAKSGVSFIRYYNGIPVALYKDGVGRKIEAEGTGFDPANNSDIPKGE